MQEIEKDNADIRPEEGNGPDARKSQDLITEDVVRGMFGESEESVKRRRKRRKKRRTMPDGEIRDPFENMNQKLEEEKRHREKGIDVPDFVLEGQKKAAGKKRKKPLKVRLFGSRKKAAAKKGRHNAPAAYEEKHETPADTEDMINIDEIKEKVKNDDGRMSTSGFIIAMALLIVGMLAIVLVTFAISRMSRAVTGGSDSSAYESAAETSAEQTAEPESEQPVSAADRLNDPDVQAALAYMATPEEVSDVSTRDMSQYLDEMPGDKEEIVKSESGILYTYETMARDLYYLTVRFPDLLTVNTIGSTKDGRAIYDAVVGNPNGASHFIVVYTQHGSEHINTQLAMRQIEYILTTWTNGGSYGDKTFSDIFSNVCFHIIPMANPDGVTISQLGVEGLRTESAKTVVNLCYELDKEHGKVYGSFEDYETKFKANANGVDLNKNFNAGWEEMDNNVNYPSTDGYKGTGAVSEPETQAIVSLAETYPISAVIGVHSPGDRIIWNYGAEGEVLNAGKNLAETLKALTKYGMVQESHYTKRVAGGMAEYFVSERNLPALSIMTGGGTLPVSMSYFADIFGRNLNVIPAIAYLYDMPTDDEIAAAEAAEAAAAAEAQSEEYDRGEDGYDVYEEDTDENDEYEGEGTDYYYDDDGNRRYY